MSRCVSRDGEAGGVPDPPGCGHAPVLPVLGGGGQWSVVLPQAQPFYPDGASLCGGTGPTASSRPPRRGARVGGPGPGPAPGGGGGGMPVRPDRRPAGWPGHGGAPSPAPPSRDGGL